MNAAALEATITDLEVTEEGPAADVHQGRPMREEYAERGAAFQRAYELGLPVGMLL